MAFNMPPYTSATRGTGFPGHGTLATPLVTTAPSLFRSTKSTYSIPEPKVPDAVITGFLNLTPAISTAVFISFLLNHKSKVSASKTGPSVQILAL